MGSGHSGGAPQVSCFATACLVMRQLAKVQVNRIRPVHRPISVSLLCPLCQSCKGIVKWRWARQAHRMTNCQDRRRSVVALGQAT